MNKHDFLSMIMGMAKQKPDDVVGKLSPQLFAKLEAVNKRVETIQHEFHEQLDVKMRALQEAEEKSWQESPQWIASLNAQEEVWNDIHVLIKTPVADLDLYEYGVDKTTMEVSREPLPNGDLCPCGCGRMMSEEETQQHRSQL
jgi:hypothetical protein